MNERLVFLHIMSESDKIVFCLEQQYMCVKIKKRKKNFLNKAIEYIQSRANILK